MLYKTKASPGSIGGLIRLVLLKHRNCLSFENHTHDHGLKLKIVDFERVFALISRLYGNEDIGVQFLMEVIN